MFCYWNRRIVPFLLRLLLLLQVLLLGCCNDLQEIVEQNEMDANAKCVPLVPLEEFEKGLDYLEIVNCTEKNRNTYDSIMIIEEDGETALGKEYIPFDGRESEILDRSQPSQPRLITRASSDEKSSFQMSQPEFEVYWKWVEEYHQFHSDVPATSLQKRKELVKEARVYQNSLSMKNATRFIIYWRSTSGLGNTIAGLAECMLLGLFTRRKIVYDWPYIPNYLAFPFTNLILDKPDLLKRPDAVISDSSSTCGFNFTELIEENRGSSVVVFKRYCGVVQHFIHTNSLVAWLVEKGILTSLSLKHLHRYHQLLQFLYVDMIQPQPFIQEQVARFKTSFGFEERYILGLHIRTGMLEGEVGWGRFLNKPDIDVFAKQATKLTKRYEALGKEVKWLVLTDYQTLREDWKTRYAMYYLSPECHISHSKHFQKDGFVCSLLENYLLSECKYLILTKQSTFGYLAKHRTEVKEMSIWSGAVKLDRKK